MLLEPRRIGVGTAQFGLDYGIANVRGRVPREEAIEILRSARAAGLEIVDTAMAYGESESVVGAALRSVDGLRVVTKLHAIETADDVASALEKSRLRLGVPRHDTVLIHDFEAYERSPVILDALCDARAAGQVARIGFSVYGPEQIEKLLARGAELDVVQVPYNLLDRRVDRVLPELSRRGVEVHARSVFLQGALLLHPERLPSHLRGLRRTLLRLREIAAAACVPLTAVMLAAVLSEPTIRVAVLGVDGLDNLEENVSALARAAELEPYLVELRSYAIDDLDVLLPMRWPRAAG